MANYSSSFHEGGALLINGKTIEDLANSAKAFLGEDPKCAIEFEGEHQIESASLHELLDDPYVRSLRINSIRLKGNAYGKHSPARSLSITIDRKYEYTGLVSVSIDGDRDACVATRAHIGNLLKGCSPWYSFLYQPVGPEFSVARILGGWLLGCTILAIGKIIVAGVPKDGRDLVDILAFALGFSFLAYYATGFLRKRMFPKLIFDIGKSSDLMHSANSWRQVILGGLLLAVSASIIATLIVDRFKG